jgi:hypothetical protein
VNDDPDKPVVDEGARESAPEHAAAGQPNLQRVLVASLIGAIILMIAMGAFWTSF